MNLRIPTLATVVMLAACSGDAAADAQAAGDSAGDSEGPAAISVSSLSESRVGATAVENQLIECVEEKGSTTMRQFFVIRDGAVLSYSQMQNAARAMCDPGQPDCALGWQGKDIGLYFRTASGSLNQNRVNLETMTMQRRLTSPGKDAVDSTATCTAGPIPADITYL